MLFIQGKEIAAILQGPLCARLGLAEYWRASGAWPDFVVNAPNRAELETELRRAEQEGVR
jgi:hypothetical protein